MFLCPISENNSILFHVAESRPWPKIGEYCPRCSLHCYNKLYGPGRLCLLRIWKGSGPVDTERTETEQQGYQFDLNDVNCSTNVSSLLAKYIRCNKAIKCFSDL